MSRGLFVMRRGLGARAFQGNPLFLPTLFSRLLAPARLHRGPASIALLSWRNAGSSGHEDGNGSRVAEERQAEPGAPGLGFASARGPLKRKAPPITLCLLVRRSSICRSACPTPEAMSELSEGAIATRSLKRSALSTSAWARRPAWTPVGRPAWLAAAGAPACWRGPPPLRPGNPNPSPRFLSAPLF